jgi:hypothetical protein
MTAARCTAAILAVAPIVYGVIADHSSRTVGVIAAALTAAAIIPLVLALRPCLRERGLLSPIQ